MAKYRLTGIRMDIEKQKKKKKKKKQIHLALFSLRTESDNPDATCELSP